MKKLLFVCAALLVVAGIAAPAAEAQFCFKWAVFCDGIQVDSIDTVNGRIESQWYHYDCANNTPMTLGKHIAPRPIPNACPGGPGDAGIACLNTGPGSCGSIVGGGDWTFVIDSPLDFTLDMNSGLPQLCWLDELAYNFWIGPCSGAPQQGPGLTSSIQ